jgi:hypothetical protein
MESYFASRVGAKWSDIEDKMLLDSIQNKKSFEEISKKHGRSITSIKLRLKKIENSSNCKNGEKVYLDPDTITEKDIVEFLENEIKNMNVNDNSSPTDEEVIELLERLV